MRHRIVMAVMLAGALLAAPASLSAEEQPAAPTPRALALAKRIMIASGAEKAVDQLLGVILPNLARTESFQRLSPEQREVIVATLRETMRDTFTPKLIAEVTPAYAAAFTESELETIAAFYEGPAGRKMVSMSSTLSERNAAAARKLLPEFQAELIRRVCEKIQCGRELQKS